MRGRIARRLGWMLPTLFAVSVLVFMIGRIVPGDGSIGAQGMEDLSPREQRAVREARVERSGADESYVRQYWRWLSDWVEWDEGEGAGVTLGYCATTRSTVAEEFARRLPVSLALNGAALGLMIVLAIPLGMVMAAQHGRRMARVIDLTLLALWSIPIVLAATLLIAYTARGGQGVQWFPTGGMIEPGGEHLSMMGRLGDVLWHMVLPVLCLTYGSLAYLARQMRGSLVEQMHEAYVRTARAKGASRRRIMVRHMVRNSVSPLIALSASVLPILIGGSVIVEMIFNIDGMGLLAFEAMRNRDHATVQTLAVLAGAANMLGLLLADVLHAWVDPRVALSAAGGVA